MYIHRALQTSSSFSGWADSNTVLWSVGGVLALPGLVPMVGAATSKSWHCLHKGMFT